ncbi:MAG: alpha/beta hydrolase [Theionarchaea archaeon]|nr:alpha/beta hydrolase [Theionarchaea archaeon]MBU7038731.1 alpha/beta hydrolase [Theionarchaea archaeon]
MSPFLILGLLILLVGVAYGGVCFLFSSLILYSHRQPIVTTPHAYGMDYEDVAFKSTDGLTLKGWFIPGESGKAIIITHPFPFNRHGFLTKNQGVLTRFKTDVDLLKTAKAMHQAGFSVLMFDFRNHGESDKGITGVGLNEYQDVVGAVTYVTGRQDVSPNIGFVSFCMGADSTIIALSKEKEQLKNVKCLVAVQPISVAVFVRNYIRSVFTPLGLILIPMVDRLCQWRGGYAFEKMSPLPYCKDIFAPTLYIQARTDPWTELSDIQGFYEATPEPKEFWMIEGAMKRFDTYNYVGEHPEKILDFISRYL